MTTKLIEAVKAYLNAEKPFFLQRRHGGQQIPTTDECIKFYAARDALALAMLEAEQSFTEKCAASITQLPRDVVDRIWDSRNPSGFGKSRYDITADIERAVLANLAKDRDVLLEVNADLAISRWNCPVCGHDEPCSTMDVAKTINRHLSKVHQTKE